MTRFQMLLKEETGAGFLARMAVMLPVFLIVYHLSAGPVRETEPCWSDSAFTGATRMR